MSKLTLNQPPAFLRSELTNRDLNAQLRRSRGTGSSFFARLATLMRIFIARQKDPKCIIERVPSVPKIAKQYGHFRQHAKRKPRKPFKAEVETILKAWDGRTYLRLDNGQIVRALRGVDIGLDYIQPNDTLVARTPGGPVTLRPADQAQLPTQNLSHP
jgi:hypothetical protein